VLDITILGGVWVASGLDAAAPGSLPAPATPAASVSSLRRLQFATSAIGGFDSALATYTPAAGFGWQSAVNSYVRPISMFPTGYTGNTAFYGSGAWGMGSSTFQIAVAPYAPLAEYAIRAYLSDPYTNWAGIVLKGEGIASVTTNAQVSPPQQVTLEGLRDVNGDGMITITVSSSIWVMNGLDFAAGDATALPAPVV